MSRPEFTFLSYGGGTQSAALALMSAAGELPKLDAVIMADTQGELPETYEYAEYVKPILERAGIPFIVVTAGNLEAALLRDGGTGPNPTPPAKVLNDDGTQGRVNAYRCSYDFKRRIVTQREKALCGKPGAWKRSNVIQWIGYSADEQSRVKQDSECRCGHPMDKHPLNRECEKCKCEKFDRWRVNAHPLIDLGWNRSDTIRWFKENGHPTPVRSACWFCPNSTNARWRQLQETHPELFDRACTIDETIRSGAAFNERGNVEFKGTLYLHDSLKPLRDADLRDEAVILADDFGVMPLFSFDCNGDSCDT